MQKKINLERDPTLFTEIKSKWIKKPKRKI